MKRPAIAYGVSLVAVIVAVLLRLLLEPLLSERLPFLTLFAAVVFALWYGGRGPALLALFLATVAALFFLFQPHSSLTLEQPEYPIKLVMFVLLGLATITLFESLRKTRQLAEEKQRELATQIAVQRDTERAVASRDELLRITFGSVGDGVITTDARGHITFLNIIAQELTGWTNAEAHHQPLSNVFRIIHEETRQPLESPVVIALREGRAVRVTNHTLLISKNGSERPIDDSAALMRDPKENIRGAVLIFRDISDRKRVEATLRAGEERFRQLADSMPQLVWIATHDGTVTYYNAQVSRYSGVHQTAEGNWVWQPILHPDDLALTQEAWSQAIADRGSYQCEHRVRMADGTYRWHLSRAYHIGSENKTPWFGTATDVHDLKLAQEQLQEADRRKDEFLATLAHELRNPLAPIRNSLELMKLRANDPELLRQCQTTMERQVIHMVRLIDDLLDVSRITRNKLELKPERVELAVVVQHALETVRPLCECAGHHLHIELPSTPIYLNADPARLGQVFGNLLTNACKYTNPQGHIWLCAERQPNEVVVSIKDTGVGIPVAMLPKIFDLFTQVDQTLERSRGGLGIGLSLVRRLVEMHGGHVTVHSDGLDQGSTFTVRLPVLDDESTVCAPAELDHETVTTSHRILVVDDNRDHADSLALILEMKGHQTMTVYDGAAGLEQAEQFQPELILLDIGLPKLNGYEVCQRIREQPWGREMIIIALTGWGQDEDRRKSKEAGFNSHLVKPVDNAMLLKLLITLRPTND